MKYLFLLKLFFISQLIFAQVNIPVSEEDNYTLVPFTGNTNITTCDMFIYDSGGENGNYEKRNNGSLTIIPGLPGQFVKLEFISFDVENKYDFVYVYDSIISPETLLGTFSGTTLPSPVVASTSSGVLIVKFESDYAVVKAGFKLYASCVDPMLVMPKNGGKKITSCDISLYDSGGTSGHYSDDENGFITVLPVSPEKKVQLDFDEIDIEEDHEWLYVYDGSDTTSPLIDIYSGTSYPETLKASPDNLSGALTIKFTSDESSSANSGFSARISCFTPVSSITISGGNISLPIDSSLKLTASVYPEDADDISITWSTSDPSIVSIDEMGNIKAVGYGSAKISAKSNDGYAVAEIDINVHELTSTRQQNLSGKFVVFPNPASDKVKLISHFQNLKVMIYDSAGKVKHRTTVENDGEIDITNLSEGIYFMEVEGEGFLEFQKLSIVR